MALSVFSFGNSFSVKVFLPGLTAVDQILKGQYTDPQMQAELDKPDNQRDIKARLLTEKTLQQLTDYSNK